ncbi:MAG: hypothetical protein JXQ29_05015 [Planctomycetes bacterium]|nr:hypothetical protein [Planctomycetota bacterium]
MGKASLDVVNEIRKVFTISYLDPSAIRVLLGSGRLVLSGIVQRLPGYASPILARTLVKLELDLASIREVRMIRWNLENWSNEGGQWRPVATRRPP